MVPEITLRSIREQAETRVVMEGYGIQWICDHKIEIGDVLRQLVANQQRVHEASPERIFEQVSIDKEFHWSLVKATGNTEFARLYDSLHDRQLRTGVALFKAVPERAKCVIEHHHNIASAVAKFEKDDALRLLRLHLIESIQQVSHVFID